MLRKTRQRVLLMVNSLQPQRPLRSIRIHDENAPPAVVAAKTIHHRNKSSPSLNTYGINGGGIMKGAVKRAAFGDVSNVAGNNRVAKDDLAIASKPGQHLHEKKISLQPIEKKTTISQPAHRLQSLAPIAKLATVSQPTQIAAIKSHHVETNAAVQIEPERKLMTKKSTVVFQDALDTQAQTLPKPLPQTVPTAPVHRDLNTKVSHVQLPKAIAAQPKLRRAQSIHISKTQEPSQPEGKIVARKEEIFEPSVVSTLSSLSTAVEENTTFRSDGAYIADDGKVHFVDFSEDKLEDPLAETSETALAPLRNLDANLIETTALLSELIDAQDHKDNISQATKQALSAVSEPEEYWDDEQYDENYDDEGFVTARSFKSKGENTTGGHTTVVVPHLNSRAERELQTAKDLIEGTRPREEIEDEVWDTSMVAEYGDDIFAYLRETELRLLPNSHYMDKQAEIQWSMRSVLMDWLVQVHHRFGLLPETLYLTVNYIDRFLSSKVVSLGKLQLVGATAIFIAAKYEEINCPSINEIVFMVDGGYSVDELLKAERFMLTMLQWQLGWPGPMSFLRRISKADDYDLETRTVAKYFLELTIMDERFVGSVPSFLAAGAHCLARMMLRKGSWGPAHVYYSGYTYSQIHGLCELMLECCEHPKQHHNAIYEKYAEKRYSRAAVFVQGEMKNGFYVPEEPSFTWYDEYAMHGPNIPLY
ncbi:hypothetical protein MMC25_002632 [Agyrium rufum]|nr:hypothetical protein [Agyrium rufum]